MEAARQADAGAPFRLSLARRRAMLEAGTLAPEVFRRALVEYVREADPLIRTFVDWRPTELTESAVPWATSVTYKDTIDVSGFATRLGISSGYREYPRHSAEVAYRLGGRGMVCIGKVATTECSLGSRIPSRNPLFPDVSASGSSTGSASAVAAGFCDLSVGTDSGGSVRWPAVYCGTTALRMTPQPDLLEGVHSVAPSMEAIGLVARSPGDLAWLWRSYGLAEVFCVRPVACPSRLRVGFSTPPGEALHPEVDAALSSIRLRWAAEGHVIVELDMAAMWRLRASAWELLAGEAYQSFASLLHRPDVELHVDTRAAIERGRGLGQARHAALLQLQSRTSERLSALLRTRCDILLMPLEAGLPDPADRPPRVTVPQVGGEVDLGMTVLASFARLPVLALPVTLSSHGSPLGIQIVAAAGCEDLLVSVGELLGDMMGSPIISMQR